MRQNNRSTWRLRVYVSHALLCTLLCLLPPLVTAQISTPPSNQQNQPGQNLLAPGTIPIPNPLAQQSAISSTASGASAPQSNTIPSSRGKSFGTIGQGLPGMTSGPTLTAPMGSQDPSARYMRPTVIPPLFCDPAINIPC
ncbi:MAG: hypothetical protein KF711_10085 [Nitrospira sp.]|nr:hypothetical protein [Nitrospira sp.]